MPKTSIEDMATSSPTSKRILSFDIIRGFLLLLILVGHIELPPDFWDFFTGRGRLYVSAAEGFFFLSGLLVGMVYRRKLANGMRYVFKKMWGRAAELYIGSIILTLATAFIVVKTNHFNIKEGLPSPLDWSDIIKRTLLLRYEYGWADFLARFAILMLIAPFVFYFIAKGRWKLVLAVIFGAYLLRGENFTLAWQTLFNGGIVVGFYWNEINRWWAGLKSKTRQIIRRSLVVVTAITFIISYATVYVLSELNSHYGSLSAGWQHFTLHWNSFTQWVFIYTDKWTLGPFRLAMFYVWAAVAYTLVRRHEPSINRRTKGLFVTIGQNSLFVYIFHSVIVLGFKFFIPVKTNALQNFAITSLALAILISGTYAYRYLRTKRPELANPVGLSSLLFRRGKSLFSPR
ncbi:OpgC domain-containing protein [Candidatus Saccharibacteria bacterium]|nr:OpgC domain-containing protein [Candidatus Saccharibacteria bacterium]